MATKAKVKAKVSKTYVVDYKQLVKAVQSLEKKLSAIQGMFRRAQKMISAFSWK